FVQVCCINDYYRIGGELYDCFLYALFVNGAQPPGEWGWGISSLSRRLRSIISFFRRTLGHVPEEGKLAAAVAAAGGSTKTQSQTQTRGSEEMEPDEEQPPPPRVAAPPFAAAAAAAGAAAAAVRRLRGDGAGVNSGDDAPDNAVTAAAASGTAAPGRPAGRGFACAPAESTAMAVDGKADTRESRQEIGVEPHDGDARPATLTLWNAATSAAGVWERAGAAKPVAGSRIRDTTGAGAGAAVEGGDGGYRRWEGFEREPV
ncbi:unnamed protein product, partial [Hapterophycus canaliculatus]